MRGTLHVSSAPLVPACHQEEVGPSQGTQTLARTCLLGIHKGCLRCDGVSYAEHKGWVPYSGLGALLPFNDFTCLGRSALFLLHPCNFRLLKRLLLSGLGYLPFFKALILSLFCLIFLLLDGINSRRMTWSRSWRLRYNGNYMSIPLNVNNE